MVDNPTTNRLEHDEAEDFESPPSDESENPSLNVSLSLPESIEIRMVEASALAEYEIWFFGASCAFSLTAAFWVAWFQEDPGRSSSILLIVALLCTGTFALFLTAALSRRKKMTKKYRSYLLKSQRIERVSQRSSRSPE
jgi:hypothetical protein